MESPARLRHEPRLDPCQENELLTRARETQTDALIVTVGGHPVIDAWFGDGEPRRIDAMSATKVVVNLAVGMLIRDGRIDSVDDPVSRFFPDYTGGGRDDVTIRHLLEHTSGIEARPDTYDIYSSPDFVQNALEKPLSTTPGEQFFYNNRAVNLLGGVASRAAGEPFDQYLDRKLFSLLGIRDFHWSRDSAGQPQGMGGLQVLSADLAKIGQFVLRGGDGLLPERWIGNSIAPTPASLRAVSACGWLWWPILNGGTIGVDDRLIAVWRTSGLGDAVVERAALLSGHSFSDRDAYYAAIREAYDGDPAGWAELRNYFRSVKVATNYSILAPGAVQGYFGVGYLGQYLVIIPEQQTVAVRMRAYGLRSDAERVQQDFGDFPEFIAAFSPT